ERKRSSERLSPPARSLEVPSLRKREHRHGAAQSRILRQRLVCTDRAEAGGVFGQARRHADAGPAADAGQNSDILLAVILVGVDVADDARRSLELVELLAGLGIDRLEVAFQRAVEHDIA